MGRILGAILISPAFNPVHVRHHRPRANVPWPGIQARNPIVAGFNIYYGGASGVYTNMIRCRPSSLTIPNLVIGATYYFAATTYSAAGAESALSGEVAYPCHCRLLYCSLVSTPQRSSF